MTQEFVTLPREVVEWAIEALFCTDSEEGSTAYKNELEAVKKLRAALDQPQNHVPNAGNMVPAGWKLVPVEPTQEMLAAACQDGVDLNGRPVWKHTVDVQAAWRWGQMLAAAPKPPTTEEYSVVQPQANQPAMTPIAQRKLDSLLAKGYTISGYSIYHEQKHQHGFVNGAGLVGWWKPEGVEYPQPHGEPSTVAFCHVGDVVVCDNDSLLRQLGVKRSDKLYLHPQDLNCKSKQALLATLWGYTKEQPKRPPLTDEEIDKLDWGPRLDEPMTFKEGLRDFARAIEAAHDIK